MAEERNQDFGLTKENLFDAFKERAKKEFKKLPSRDRPAGVDTGREYASWVFGIHQSSMEQKWALRAPKFEVKGNIQFLKVTRGARDAVENRRLAFVPLYGYGPDDTNIILNAGVNLSSTKLWTKAAIVRWKRTYDYATAHDYDIYNMEEWAEAAERVDQRVGNITIWNILTDVYIE